MSQAISDVLSEETEWDVYWINHEVKRIITTSKDLQTLTVKKIRKMLKDVFGEKCVESNKHVIKGAIDREMEALVEQESNARSTVQENTNAVEEKQPSPTYEQKVCKEIKDVVASMLSAQWTGYDKMLSRVRKALYEAHSFSSPNCNPKWVAGRFHDEVVGFLRSRIAESHPNYDEDTLTGLVLIEMEKLESKVLHGSEHASSKRLFCVTGRPNCDVIHMKHQDIEEPVHKWDRRCGACSGWIDLHCTISVYGRGKGLAPYECLRYSPECFDSGAMCSKCDKYICDKCIVFTERDYGSTSEITPWCEKCCPNWSLRIAWPDGGWFDRRRSGRKRRKVVKPGFVSP